MDVFYRPPNRPKNSSTFLNYWRYRLQGVCKTSKWPPKNVGTRHQNRHRVNECNNSTIPKSFTYRCRSRAFGISSTTPTIGLYKFSNNNWNPVTTTWNNFVSGTYQYLSAASIPYEDQYYYWNVLSALSNGILSLALTLQRYIVK